MDDHDEQQDNPLSVPFNLPGPPMTAKGSEFVAKLPTCCSMSRLVLNSLSWFTPEITAPRMSFPSWIAAPRTVLSVMKSPTTSPA